MARHTSTSLQAARPDLVVRQAQSK
uniref:PTGES3L-AARSD1 readthrough n=1 Tax=Homo sapiens TaxID=9606 RepID=C9JUA3_HUMAN